MPAPDFYFSVNAIFRHVHDGYGKAALVRYWRTLALDHYRARIQLWREGGLAEVAKDWTHYFGQEPGAVVNVTLEPGSVELDVQICPAIKHLRLHGRDIVPCFCEHCDHTCGAMAEAAGLTFERTGGMGSCRQRFSMPDGRGGQT